LRQVLLASRRQVVDTRHVSPPEGVWKVCCRQERMRRGRVDLLTHTPVVAVATRLPAVSGRVHLFDCRVRQQRRLKYSRRCWLHARAGHKGMCCAEQQHKGCGHGGGAHRAAGSRVLPLDISRALCNALVDGAGSLYTVALKCLSVHTNAKRVCVELPPSATHKQSKAPSPHAPESYDGGRSSRGKHDCVWASNSHVAGSKARLPHHHK